MQLPRPSTKYAVKPLRPLQQQRPTSLKKSITNSRGTCPTMMRSLVILNPMPPVCDAPMPVVAAAKPPPPLMPVFSPVQQDRFGQVTSTALQHPPSMLFGCSPMDYAARFYVNGSISQVIEGRSNGYPLPHGPHPLPPHSVFHNSGEVVSVDCGPLFYTPDLSTRRSVPRTFEASHSSSSAGAATTAAVGISQVSQSPPPLPPRSLRRPRSSSQNPLRASRGTPGPPLPPPPRSTRGSTGGEGMRLRQAASPSPGPAGRTKKHAGTARSDLIDILVLVPDPFPVLVRLLSLVFPVGDGRQQSPSYASSEDEDEEGCVTDYSSVSESSSTFSNVDSFSDGEPDPHVSPTRVRQTILGRRPTPDLDTPSPQTHPRTPIAATGRQLGQSPLPTSSPPPPPPPPPLPPCPSVVKPVLPAVYRRFIEQKFANVGRIHKEREERQARLEAEMALMGLSETSRAQMRKMLQTKESNYMRMQRARMDESMFIRIKRLGVGAFGWVWLVRKKENRQLYAMKILKKRDVVRRRQLAHVQAERDILAEADSDWVVKLFFSFQDSHALYLVMEYIPGELSFLHSSLYGLFRWLFSTPHQSAAFSTFKIVNLTPVQFTIVK
ncbi:unnamed protein product [Schistocephalus solidus]|uniref:non-specific serine/threonine protein kinase n=1 Tax=Schistocephalus solidus TaxID=70667 RepID=A0A183TGV3_SCHSO|nr:unnamed protein product [Schistocephalus solidus]